jgi:hypothetical protein
LIQMETNCQDLIIDVPLDVISSGDCHCSGHLLELGKGRVSRDR